MEYDDDIQIANEQIAALQKKIEGLEKKKENVEKRSGKTRSIILLAIVGSLDLGIIPLNPYNASVAEFESVLSNLYRNYPHKMRHLEQKTEKELEKAIKNRSGELEDTAKALHRYSLNENE